jgi:DNA-binding NarL/FixJ family response regulator
VDDDYRVGNDLRKLLGPLGYEVHVAEGEGEALLLSATEEAQRLRPHVVIVDVRLVERFADEDRKGLDLLRSSLLRSPGRIVYSGHLETLQTIREAMEAADSVVGKGEKPLALLAATQKAARHKCGHETAFRLKWPSAWSPERVIHSLFGETTEVPASLAEDVFCGVFTERESLQLSLLDNAGISPPTRARSRSIVFEARPDGLQPVLVKLAPSERIAQEVAAYDRYVSGRLGGSFRPSRQAHAMFWELGAIRYDLIGSSSTVQTFARHYVNRTEPDEIVRPLLHFCSTVWKMNYEAAQAAPEPSLFAGYDRLLSLDRRLTEMVSGSASHVYFPEIGRTFEHPAAWVLAHRADSDIAGRSEVVVHGDLHANNLLTDGTHAWAIDFERTGYGPCFADQVELEQDILARLALPFGDDIVQFYRLAQAAVAPVALDRSLGAEKGNDELTKACRIIEEIRSVAIAMTGSTDVREYYWGLLFHALTGASVAQVTSHKGRRCLLLAALLCERLKGRDDAGIS